jgi:tetratricopeptide (TPR) repeat protein
MWEHFLLDGDLQFDEIVKSDPGVHVALAIDYAHAGLFEEAITLLEQVSSDTMAAYTLGWVFTQASQDQAAERMFRRAAALSPDYCFPNRLEDVLILESAQEANPQDGLAPYYLGNFWYAHRRYEEAISCWEKSVELNGSFAIANRNLGLAYFNKRHDASKALAYFERAFALNPQDARVFFELDQLYRRLNRSPAERATSLQKHLDLVEQRDDLMIEYITLLNLLGRHEEAYQELMHRNFHPWEGGEGKVTGQYIISLVERARALIAVHKVAEAIELLEQAQNYPSNLGEGKLYGNLENNIFYYLGCAFEQMGENEAAIEAFTRASIGRSDPGSAMYYNDQPPEMIFYQGLALLKLGRLEDAQATFRKLVDYGTQHMNNEIVMDYFAVSLPDFLIFETDLNARNRLHCHYLLGLGYLGLGYMAAAKEQFTAVIDGDASHLGANLHMRLIG